MTTAVGKIRQLARAAATRAGAHRIGLEIGVQAPNGFYVLLSGTALLPCQYDAGQALSRGPIDQLFKKGRRPVAVFVQPLEEENLRVSTKRAPKLAYGILALQPRRGLLASLHTQTNALEQSAHRQLAPAS